MAHVNLTPARDATSFASSSTSPSHGNTNSYVYDVFVNHRGPDVKKGLASHIYHSLKALGLAVFLDQPELQKGENLKSQIEGVIQRASVHIAIFSPRYAESVWCLTELVQMCDSGSTIIPVFYKVEPADLRWTQDGDGVYARALGVLEGKKTLGSQPRYDSNTIKKWRTVLSHVANISGFELKAYNDDEGQLVHEVVQQVLKNVRVRKPPLNVAEYPTGLDEKLKDVDRTLSLQRQSHKARVLGIVGLGGVGKTTLAKKFYNREKSNYKRICFLLDVRSSNLPSLVSSLLKELTQSSVQINNIDEGIEKLKTCSELALIVLDDVDHIDQLKALFSPVKDIIHSGSLILVTSRNKDVLRNSGIGKSSIYTLKELNPEHSKELFCSHAFGKPHLVIEGFEEVVENFLKVCKGLPLTLKVLGALLHGNDDLEYWNAQLQKTLKTLPKDIRSRLKISYDALDEEEKQIFLDVACFFIGEYRDTAIRIWDGCNCQGFLGLWKLENRCLVEVDSENCLTMHDHLRDLGRDMEENSECRRRLWRGNLLHNVSDQSPVRGIIMVHGNSPEQSFENLAGSCNLSRLQLLRAESHFVEQVFSIGQLPPLIYLHWDNCRNSSLPSSIALKNLRVLHIESGQLKTLWQDESQAPLQLRELHIDAPLSKVPESIGKLKHLEEFALYNSYLETLPNEFCDLHSLKHVVLKYCGKLTLVPHSIGNLTHFQSLELSGCSTLRTLPDSVGNMTGLQGLSLTGCSTLQTLPDSVGNLTGLQGLYMPFCFTLQRLPNSVGKLTGLQVIHLAWCSSLQTLPDSIGNLTGLQVLHLAACSTMRTLPETIGNLTGLQYLCLARCSILQTLPDSVGNLTGLQNLHLTRCSNLQRLPDSVGNLTGLWSLHLTRCSILQTLPDSVGNLTGLRSLDLTGCSTLQTLPDSVGNLTSLQGLNLSWCSKLQTLPDSVGNLTGLQGFHLVFPDSDGNLTGLRGLHLAGCSALQTLPDSVGKLTGLQGLHLAWCFTLQTLPDSVGNLTGLQSLDLTGCSTVQTLPDSVGNLTGLRHLYLSRCYNLHMLPNIGHLSSLEMLDVSRCTKLQWGVGVVQLLRQRLRKGFIENKLF